MIKEIINPLPTIQEYLSKKSMSQKIREKYNLFSELDVSVEEDSLLVDEFAERTGLDKVKAEQIIVAFFEEIKKQMLEGNIVSLIGFGKFYINGPRRNTNREFILPVKRPTLIPRFKANISFKRLLRENSKDK